MGTNGNGFEVRSAVGYIRVSTSEQHDNGSSLEAQRAQLTTYCEARAWPLAQMFEDTATGGTPKRTGLQAMLAALAPGVVIITPAMDRLTRRVRDWLHLLDLVQKRGAAIVTIREGFDLTTAVGRAAAQILAAVSELERGLVSERTKAVIAYKKQALEVWGPVPFGLRRQKGGKALIPDGRTLPLVREILGRRQQGESFGAIAADLNRRKVRTPEGRLHWHRETVRRVTLNADVYERAFSGAGQAGRALPEVVAQSVRDDGGNLPPLQDGGQSK